MNIGFIGRIAKKYPALARFFEVTIIGLIIGALITLVQGAIQYIETGTLIDIVAILKTFLVGILTAVGVSLNKLQRDLANK